MNSLYSFIVTPYKERYDNTKIIDDKELIINTTIENHIFVSKKAVVVSTPSAFESCIKPGDIVYVHHNIFRRYYDIKGKEKNSGIYFKDNYCFVEPIKEINDLYNRKEKEYFGILKYSNSSLEDVGLKPGALVVFTPNSEFEFIIEGKRLYCMKSNDIAVTNEYEGNEEKNNPSWTEGS